MVARSLAEYDTFYRCLEATLEALISRFGRVVLFDLHSYNHRRGGVDGPVAEPDENPEINVGTGTMDRQRWSPIVDRFIDQMRGFDFLGRRLDVRENLKFSGGQFSRWVHERFPETACSIAVEVKKFFMDEWSGEVDQTQLHEVGEALRAAGFGVLEELRTL